MATRNRQLSPQAIAVVGALNAYPTIWRYGYDLATELGLKSGTLYPILMRLADRGLLETKWEATTGGGRPPRHLYRLTSAGRELAAAVAPAPASARRVKRATPKLREAW